MQNRYLDHAATTPVDPRVLQVMLPFFSEHFGNAHSIHSWGRQAHSAVEIARQHVAYLIGAEDPSEIVFTSGATEANNTVLRAFEGVAVSPVEHSSVLEPAKVLGHSILPYGDEPFIQRWFDLQSVQWVNHETGAIYGGPGPKEHDFPRVAEKRHTDATQAVGKLPVSVDGYDFLSLSGHKFYGPKGIGALYVRGGMGLPPFLVGGGQEAGMRSGTLAVPLIVGLGEAARIALEESAQNFNYVKSLREALLEETKAIPDTILHGKVTSPYIVCLSFLGVEGEALVVDLDQQGFAISAGSACSSGSTDPSPVLLAMGAGERVARSAVRISFGVANQLDDVAALARALSDSVSRLRGFSR